MYLPGAWSHYITALAPGSYTCLAHEAITLQLCSRLLPARRMEPLRYSSAPGNYLPAHRAITSQLCSRQLYLPGAWSYYVTALLQVATCPAHGAITSQLCYRELPARPKEPLRHSIAAGSRSHYVTALLQPAAAIMSQLCSR